MFFIFNVQNCHTYLTINLDPAGSWRVNLMMCLTNRVYHRRALSYWFHIICNSLYLPSRPFSSPPCFMWLCPFLIIVTDRRSAEKDGENERESRDFVTGVFVSMWMLAVGWVWVWVWTSPRYHPYRLKPLPTPHPFLSLSSVSWGMCHPKKDGMTEICAKQSQLM